ncbi:MAG: hypothetical protein MNPFHGCM_00054 [Gemmatimonadaceae bacterium]|nr:hypothetical protein [Gemmatimonadaceae bacterium]
MPPLPVRSQSSPQAPAARAVEQSVTQGTPASASDMYNAMRAQRRVLQSQLESLEEKRSDLVRQTRSSDIGSTERAGLEARIKEIDTRIASVDQEIATSDAAVARAAAVPGAVVEPTPIPRSGPPEEVYFLTGLFMFVVLLPLSIAYARRLWRRAPSAPIPVSPEMGERFNRLEQAVDAIAVEVERVGEGQRFLSRQFTSPAALGAGPAEPIELRQREPLPAEQHR